MTQTGYYITYRSGHGVWGFTGADGTPFHYGKEPILFTDRKEAREALAYVRKNYASNLKHYVANRFRIVDAQTDCSYIGNLK